MMPAKKRLLLLLMLCSGIAGAIAAINPKYEVGCALRKGFAGKPGGDAAAYRYTGYLEAMEVLAHSDLPPEVISAAVETLLSSSEIDKYIVARP